MHGQQNWKVQPSTSVKGTLLKVSDGRLARFLETIVMCLPSSPARAPFFCRLGKGKLRHLCDACPGEPVDMRCICLGPPPHSFVRAVLTVSCTVTDSRLTGASAPQIIIGTAFRVPGVPLV